MKRSLRLIIINCILALLLCGCAAKEEIAVPAATKMPVATEPPADEYAGRLIVSELMAKNRCTVTDSDGDFSDWIELHNPHSEALSLEGWAISDGEGAWQLPAISLEGEERLLVFASGKDRKDGELHTDFKLSEGETLSLISPAGTVVCEVFCADAEADTALYPGESGYESSLYASPGFDSYESFQNALVCKGPLAINEIVNANKFGENEALSGGSDWVIIENISDEAVNLEDFYLSDDDDDYKAYRLPDVQLRAGKTITLLCNDEGIGEGRCTGFELSSSLDRLYLSRGDELVDFALIRDIPPKGSYGRMHGENGFFFFSASSLEGLNTNGLRRVSAVPHSGTKDGVFEGIDSVSVEFSAKGKIYYTTDGSLPNAQSREYTGPISVSKTCVVRAVSVEEGALPSPALTLSFIMNEGHSLPVLSLATDDTDDFRRLYNYGSKSREVPASISMYEADGSFTVGCGVTMSGHSSLVLPKKSMKLSFRGVYGDDPLRYDVFDKPLQEFSSLVLRSGQDSDRLIFRQEIWQELCLEMTDRVTTQYSKYAVLYINGEYFGIVCVKENVSAEHYAAHRGVSEDSVYSAKTPELDNGDFETGVYQFCRRNNMAEAENYEYIKSVLDIDSFIDWAILEGVSANFDLYRNARFFRSTETDGKWQACLFDLDNSFFGDYFDGFKLGYSVPENYTAFTGLMGYSPFSSPEMSSMVHSLFRNPEFKDKFLRRYAEVYDTVLSDESILEKAEYFSSLLAPEVERDRAKWQSENGEWELWVEHHRMIIDSGWQEKARDSLCSYLGLTEAEKAEYFG